MKPIQSLLIIFCAVVGINASIIGTAYAEYDGVSVTADAENADSNASLSRIYSTIFNASSTTQIVNVGSLRHDRVEGGPGFNLTTGSLLADARSELSNPANFGPDGVVDAQFLLQPAIYNITAASLANTDVFWAGLALNSAPLTAAEQLALFNYVLAGHALIVIADVGPNYSVGPNSVAAAFGVAWSSSAWINTSPTVTDPAHPIINGPFGMVNTIAHASEGSINNLGLYGFQIASNSLGSSIADIPPGSLGPNSGPVVFFSDVNEFSTNSTPYGIPFNLGDNRVLFRNLFAYLASTGAPNEVEVDIDIKPGSFPNSINPGSKGSIPVAILTSDTFDALDVDTSTVTFGPLGEAMRQIESHAEDVDGDGDLDLVMHFNTRGSGIACGDTSASINGSTFSGQAITGSDSIRTVGCRNK